MNGRRQVVSEHVTPLVHSPRDVWAVGFGLVLATNRVAPPIFRRSFEAARSFMVPPFLA